MGRNEGRIVEIRILESDGSRVEAYKFCVNDFKRKRAIMNLLKYKWGILFFDKPERKLPDDLEWIK